MAPRVSPDKRGVAQRHERAVGCGGRGACEDERKAVADGEVVWSWRPGAGAKFCGRSIRRVTVAKEPVTGESTK